MKKFKFKFEIFQIIGLLVYVMVLSSYETFGKDSNWNALYENIIDDCSVDNIYISPNCYHNGIKGMEIHVKVRINGQEGTLPSIVINIRDSKSNQDISPSSFKQLSKLSSNNWSDEITVFIPYKDVQFKATTKSKWIVYATIEGLKGEKYFLSPPYRLIPFTFEPKYYTSKDKENEDKLNNEEGNDKNDTDLNKKTLATVDWLSPEGPVSSKNFTIKFGVKSNSQITKCVVTLNGASVRGSNTVENDGYAMAVAKTVSLRPGTNTIKAEITNGHGTTYFDKTIIYEKSDSFDNKVIDDRENDENRKEDIATVDWLSPDGPVSSKDYTIRLGVKSNSQITKCDVTLNGASVRGISTVENDGYAMAVAKTVSLQPGTNTIKAEITNGHGTTYFDRTIVYETSDGGTFKATEKRIALVIGNAAYQEPDLQLRNSRNDAEDMKAKLETLGFEVVYAFDASQQIMDEAISSFGEKATNYDVALFYYSGHGLSSDGFNYMIPVDVNLPNESYVKYRCVNINQILAQMEEAKCLMKIIILDACRSNPFLKSWTRGINGENGLESMEAPNGTFIAFSTAPGKVALDGNTNERNSPYTSALLRNLDIPNLPIYPFFENVLKEVAKKTNQTQCPWISSSFIGNFIFNPQ